ncbi:pseudouridylate synthase [Diplocarpon rosae]|nr:pseudouridylate synthase [Diplocarpon rosae]
MRLLFSPAVRRIEPRRLVTTGFMSRSGRWTKNPAARKGKRSVLTRAYQEKMEAEKVAPPSTDYGTWSQEKLIERLTQLENELKSKNRGATSTPERKSYKKPRTERSFDPSKYSTRLVAFKLAYLGKRYNGFECTQGFTPLPTIEEELWKAFNKARLIFPDVTNPREPGEVNWDGCEYSKCGRTDKGVSAFGQVIGMRVRSNRPLAKRREDTVAEDSGGGRSTGQADTTMMNDQESVPTGAPERVESRQGFNSYARPGSLEMASLALTPSRLSPQPTPTPVLGLSDPDYQDALNFDPIADEIPYCSVLNRLLPPDIRILAWCPAPPQDFSARFSCRERQYRYFFTQPAFMPTPSQLELPRQKNQVAPEGKMKDGWLDIEKMREAAKLYEGVHDFRNFCKVDPGKQISNFDRRIFFSDIEEVDDSTSGLAFVNGPDLATPAVVSGNPKVYTFTLHGSAFLWHQVRHMVAILFLVGQGLEKPSIITELLDVEENPGRPTYEMATDTPLVLWNCVFPREDDLDRKDAMQWHYVGDDPNSGDTKYGTAGIMDELWKVWRERKIDETLASTLLGVVAKQGNEARELSLGEVKKASRSQKVFDGGDMPRLQGLYTPVMKKPRMETVDVVNERYAVKKGFENSADMKLQGFRRLNKSSAVEDTPGEEVDE